MEDISNNGTQMQVVAAPQPLLEKIKIHILTHKFTYLCLGVGFVVVSVVLGVLYATSQSKNISQIPANTLPNTNQVVSQTSPILTPAVTAMPTLSPTPTIDPTAAWNVYTATGYNYSIKYPLDWNVVNLGQLEPLIPSYVVFNPNTASASARSITISASLRTYNDQVALNSAVGSAIKVGSISGTLQNLRDSDGNLSESITLPGNKIYVLHAKQTYDTILTQMLGTIKITN